MTELIEELETYGVPNAKAHLLIARAITIGAEAAVYRPETADKVAEIQIERQLRRSHFA